MRHRNCLDIFDELHEDLGIGLALEHETTLLQLLTKRTVILDDAIVDQGDVTGLGKMRMCICLAGSAMGSPTRMSNAQRSGLILVASDILEVAHLAFRLIDIEMTFALTTRNQRTTSAIIPTILQTMQSLDQNRISFTRADVTNNSAHNSSMIN